MTRMILYKEWLKTRWILLGILVVTAAITSYCLLNLGKVAEIRGNDIIWITLLTKDTVLTDILQYLPMIAGIVLGVSQFLPEISRKRLKLTLHLPFPQWKMIALMVLYGLMALTLTFTLQAVALSVVFRRWVAAELVTRIILTMLPWYLAGWAAYLWTTAICLEPAWKLRTVLAIIGAGLLRLLFLTPVPEAYNCFLPALAVYTCCGALLIGHGIIRFKEGIQD